MGILEVILNRGSIFEIIACLISSAIVIFFCMPIHEYAHGFVAEKLGDPTPRWQGRMSLNPIKHIDYVGAVMIFLIGFGWAKPVQVDSRYFKNEKRGMALTALAGPISNLIFALIFSFIYSTLIFIFNINGGFGWTGNEFAYYLFITFMLIINYIIIISISLAIFNLIPVPPLDGSKILFSILPDRIYWKIMQYERYLYFGLMFLLFAGSGSRALSNVVSYVYGVFLRIASLPFEIFLG